MQKKTTILNAVTFLRHTARNGFLKNKQTKRRLKEEKKNLLRSKSAVLIKPFKAN